jgi:hypothetical protein
MQVLMWIAVGMAVVLGFIVLMPVLVVGTWFVVMTVILGLADGILWVLDQGWKKNKGGGRAGTPVLRVEGKPRGTC